MSFIKMDQICIKNFKCHKRTEQNLASINILTGSNAAGKSSFIQAILLAYKCWDEFEKRYINTNNIMGVNLGIPINIISEEFDQKDVEICIITEKINNVVRLALRDNVENEMCFDILNYEDIAYKSLENGNLKEINLFFLNAERKGPRIISPITEPLSYSVGYFGENTAYLISKMDKEQKLKNKKLPDALRISELERFSANCEAWLNVIIPQTEVQYSVDVEKNIAILKYKNDGEFYVPTATGFGISYTISIIVQALVASMLENSVLIVENPEAHLHPYSQSQLGKFLTLVALNGVQIIVETHSEHIVDGARIQATKEERCDEIQVLFFEKKNENSVCKQILVQENGELDEWPSGFFDQKRQDLRELLELRRCQN